MSRCFAPRRFRERVPFMMCVRRGVGNEMRRDQAVAAQRALPNSNFDSPRTTSEHWRQLAGEMRRFDVAIERILRVLDDELSAFVRTCNAR